MGFGWHRDFFDAEIVECPDKSVIGKSFGQVGIDRGGLHPVEMFDPVVEHGSAAAVAHHDLQPPPRGPQEDGLSPVSRWAFRTPAHTCATWRSTTGCGLLRHSPATATLWAGAVHDDRAGCTVSPANWPTGNQIDAGQSVTDKDRTPGNRRPHTLTTKLDSYAEEQVEQYGGLSRMVKSAT